jgi:hypothetical protein
MYTYIHIFICIGGSQPMAQQTAYSGGIGMGLAAPAPAIANQQPTRVLKLMNMVTKEELNDDRLVLYIYIYICIYVYIHIYAYSFGHF